MLILFMKYQYQITDISNKQSLEVEKLIAFAKSRDRNIAIYTFTCPLLLGI